MRVAAGIVSVILILVILIDVFHTIVLARRTRRSFRITGFFYRLTWRPYAAIARRIKSGHIREDVLGVYGPLSLIALFAFWAVSLILGFALLQWSAGFRQGNKPLNLRGDLYVSANTLFTLETGNPQNTASRFVTTVEGGLGLTLLGLVVGYLPVFYEAFSGRELQISLLDARAGSPPSACGLLNLPISEPGRMERYLERSEHWAAEILGNQLSFPMMAFFRSHHANQSWVTALTALIDTSAVVRLCAEGDLKIQADLTFAMIRHALSDIAGVFRLDTHGSFEERLHEAEFAEIRRTLQGRPGDTLDPARLHEAGLRNLTRMYEPQAHALSRYLLMRLPEWTQSLDQLQNWEANRPLKDSQIEAVSDPFRKDWRE